MARLAATELPDHDSVEGMQGEEEGGVRVIQLRPVDDYRDHLGYLSSRLHHLKVLRQSTKTPLLQAVQL